MQGMQLARRPLTLLCSQRAGGLQPLQVGRHRLGPLKVRHKRCAIFENCCCCGCVADAQLPPQPQVAVNQAAQVAESQQVS